MPKNNLVLRDANLRYRNFSGKPGKFNAEGDRNFCVDVPEELAKMLIRDGWNVKTVNKKSPEEDDIYYIKVNVRFNSRIPPKIVSITSGGATILDEESIDQMDQVDIAKADLSINPYESEVRGEHHVTGYLKSLFVTVDEDELDKEYSDVLNRNLPKYVPEDDDLPF